jgi:hypothetical protein
LWISSIIVPNIYSNENSFQQSTTTTTPAFVQAPMSTISIPASTTSSILQRPNSLHQQQWGAGLQLWLSFPEAFTSPLWQVLTRLVLTEASTTRVLGVLEMFAFAFLVCFFQLCFFFSQLSLQSAAAFVGARSTNQRFKLQKLFFLFPRRVH